MNTNLSLYQSNAENFLKWVIFPELEKVPANERQRLAFFKAVQMGTAISTINDLSNADMTRLQFVIGERIEEFLKQSA
jgi:hypothetical protein